MRWIATATALLVCGCVSKGGSESSSIEGPAKDTLESTSSVLDLSFSEDSRYLARLTRDGLNLWDVLGEKSVWSREFPDGGGKQMDLASKSRFAVVFEDGIQCWDGNKVTTLPLPSGGVAFIRFDHSGEQLLVAGEDGSVSVWNVATSRAVAQPVLGAEGNDWRVLPGTGFGVLILDGSDRVRVLDLGPSKMDVTLYFEREPTGAIAVAFDGKSLASTNRQGAVEIRALPEGTVTSLLTGFETHVESVALSPDGSVLAVAVADTAVELWDTRTNERLEWMESTTWPDLKILFSSDGNSLVWVEADRTKVKYWSLALGVAEWTPQGRLLIPAARGICHDTASITRFRLASGPYERGVRLLEEDKLDEARLVFTAARRYFPSYPGLLEAANLAEERHRARVLALKVGEESRALVVSGKFFEALSLLDDFLARYEKFGEYDFRRQAKALRVMFKHLELARAHRNAGANVSAIVEFSRGVDSVPELKTFYPEYDELGQQVMVRLTARADEAYLAGAHEVLLEVYADMRRLGLLGSKALYRVGTAHEGLGDVEEAVSSYEAIDLGAEEYIEGRRSLARIARNREDLMQAKIMLWQARKIDPRNAELAGDYADVLRRMEDFEVAISVWNEVGTMQPDDPVPYEMIARIEEKRENWKQVGQAYREAVRRSVSPRPRLLWRIAQAFRNANMSRHVLAAYVDLLAIADVGEDVSWLGDDPGQVVRNRIRDQGFVHHMGQWIPKDQFLSQQGWVLFNNEWVRPEEGKLREVAFLHANTEEDYLRGSPDSHYEEMARKKRISLGMNRREVVQAWGFFEDQNVFRARPGESVFEQLLFENARQVYLKDGLVCFWTE